MKSVALLLLVAACSAHAYTPSARPLPLSPARTPAQGKSDIQVDGNASGEVMGPSILAGNARYRRGITDSVALTGDLGVVHVQNAEERSENAWAGLGRFGVQSATAASDDLDAAVFAGAGGGYAPAAGGWLSADVGGMLTGTNGYVRPIFLADAYASQPFATREFDVGSEMLRLPRTYGVQGLFGFEIGPQRGAMLVGLALAQLWSEANDVQEAKSTTFIGLGGGVRFDTE